MRRAYTPWPLDKPDPGLRGANRVWTPVLKVRVLGPSHRVSPSIPAVVDSGAPYCLFRAEVANYLKLPLKNGPEGGIGGIIGGVREPVYFHQVNIVIEDNWTISVWAGFMRKLSVTAILGRAGFFDKFQVMFDHSQSPPEFEVTKIDLIS